MKTLKTLLILIFSLTTLFIVTSCNECTYPVNLTNSNYVKIDTIKIDSLERDLIIYYTFDSSNSKDYSGNSNHGKLNGQYSFVNGIKGQSLRLTGSGSLGGNGGHVIMPFIDLNKYSAFTASIWVYEISWTDQGGGAIFTIGEEYAGSVSLWKAWGRPRLNLDRKIKFSVGSYWDGNEAFLPSSFLAMYEIDDINSDFNNWTMYTIVYENEIMNCYRNGELVGSINQKVKVSGNVAAIGRHWWDYGNKTTSRFNGYVDEFRLYGKALSNQEVKNLFNKK